MQEELGGTQSAVVEEEDGLALPDTPVQAADDWWAKRFQALFLPNITYPDSSMGFIQVRTAAGSWRAAYTMMHTPQPHLPPWRGGLHRA